VPVATSQLTVAIRFLVRLGSNVSRRLLLSDRLHLSDAFRVLRLSLRDADVSEPLLGRARFCLQEEGTPYVISETDVG
jgi:hypothetical protein